MHGLRLTLSSLFAAAVALALVVTIAPADDAAKAKPPAFTPIAAAQLHNVHRVTDKVISGSQPDGEAGFRALAELGVKTIISVDGAKPDVELARKHGLRYVHLPIGYDDVPPETGQALAKAIDELPGPLYIHCHHGKHRSAAAVAVACVVNGSLPPERAEAVLETFGTGANYKGLWQAARAAQPLDPQKLAELKVEYVEVAKVGPLAEAMVDVDHRFEHLKAIAAAGWRAPEHHPDLDPPHEAMLLMELLHEINRTPGTSERGEDYARLLISGERAAAALRDALAAKPVRAPDAEAAFKSLSGSCRDCHAAHRD